MISETHFRIAEAAEHIATGNHFMAAMSDQLATGELISAGATFQMAIQSARAARSHLALARMELAREVVHAIDTGTGITTPAQWALATKILKPLRLTRTKGGK